MKSLQTLFREFWWAIAGGIAGIACVILFLSEFRDEGPKIDEYELYDRGAVLLEERDWLVSKRRAQEELRRLKNHVEKYRLVPITIDGKTGKVDGFEIRMLAEDSLLYKAGFREGDKVRELDGKPITRIDDITGIYDLIGKTNELRVRVTRNNANLDFVFRFK